jgi:hypothetical protein
MSTVAYIIDMTRKLALDDTVEGWSEGAPTLWGDDELIYLLNRAFNELIKIPLIKDQTTVAIREIRLVSNLGVYPLDSRILKIDDARLETNATYGSLVRTTEERLNKTRSDWRSLTGTPVEYAPEAYAGYLSVYPKFDDTGEIEGASDISFVAATKTISQVGGDFSALAVGDEFLVSGTNNNNGYKTVATAGTTSITVSETSTTESNTSAIIRPVRDTLLLSVSRLGTARFTTADITAATEISELRDDQADGLIDGIAKRAFLKPDSQTFDPKQAEIHRQLFEVFKKDIRRDLILLNKPDKSRAPRSGTSIYY